MSRRDVAWFAALAVLVLLVSASAPAFPQEPADGAGADAALADDAAGTAAAPGAAPSGAGTPDSSTVETILRQQEDLLRGQHFSYEPEGRRDPFQSLFETVKPKIAGPRPTGPRGMLVSEIDLDGIVKDRSGAPLAFFTGSDNKGYFLRVGDSVYDGTLIAIDPRSGAVTFRQQVDDPRMIKPYRDVVMRLVPQDEETSDE